MNNFVAFEMKNLLENLEEAFYKINLNKGQELPMVFMEFPLKGKTGLLLPTRLRK